MDLKQESERATEMLKGKVVEKILRHREKEVGLEFTDGTRLFVDAHDGELELSITGGSVKEIGD
jgi:hypothetical protein